MRFFFFFQAHHSTPLTTTATDKQCVTIHKWNECQCAEMKKCTVYRNIAYIQHTLLNCWISELNTREMQRPTLHSSPTIYMQNGIIVFYITCQCEREGEREHGMYDFWWWQFQWLFLTERKTSIEIVCELVLFVCMLFYCIWNVFLGFKDLMSEKK